MRVDDRGFRRRAEGAGVVHRAFRGGSRATWILALGLAGAGCRPAPAPPLAPACPAPGVDTAGWQLKRGTDFSFRIPPGYRERESRPVDQEIQWYHGPTGTVHYSLGPYTDPPQAGLPGFSQCTESVGGRPAQVSTYRDPRSGRYVAAGFWDLGQGAMGRVGLRVTATAAHPRHQAEMLAVVRSVEIVPPRR